MRFLRLWLPVAVFALVVLAGSMLTWIVTSESGARWLLARLSGYLPASLTLGPIEGNLTDGVRLQGIRWRDATVDLSAVDTFIDVELRPLIRRQLIVTRLDVGSLEVELATAGDSAGEPALPEFALPVDLRLESAEILNLDLRRGEQRVAVNRIEMGGRLDGPDLALRRLLVEADDFRVDASGRASFAAPHGLDLDVDWRWRSPEAVEFAGVLHLEGSSERYALRHGLASPVAVATTGSVTGIPRDPVFELRNEWESLSWPVGGYALHAGAGSLDFSGKPAGYVIALSTVAGWQDLPDTSLSLAASGDLDSLSVTRLQLNSGEGNLVASGRFRWAPSIGGEADFELAGVDPRLAQPWVAYPMPGAPLSASGHVAFADDVLRFDDTRIELGDNHLFLDGTFGPEIAASGNFDFPAVGQLLAGAAGSLRGNFELADLRSQPTGKLSIGGESLAFRDYSVGSFDASLDAPAGGGARLRAELEALGLPGFRLDALLLEASGDYEAHALSARVEQGDARLALAAAGAYADGEWRGAIGELSIDSPLLDRWSSRDGAEVSLAPGLATLSALCLHADAGRACLEGSWSADAASTLALRLDGLPLAALPLRLPAGTTLGGSLQADAAGTYESGSFGGEMRLGVSNGSIATEYEGETFSLEFARAEAAATLAENRVVATTHLQAASGVAVLSATVALDDFLDGSAPMRGTASVGIPDAGVISALIPGVSDVEGRLTGVLDAAGSLAAPALTGQVAISDGAFSVRQTGITVTDVNATLRQTGAGQLELNGSARSGEGTVRVEGNTRFAKDGGIRTDLLVSGENVRIARLPNWEVAASPQISVTLDERATAVTGDLDIPYARINLRSLPETAVRASPDVVVHRAGGEAAPPRRRRIDVDVNASLGDEVRFAGFGLTAGIEGAVRIRGGSESPYVGSGRLDLRDGRYKAYGQELEIEQGALLFNGPLDNPDIDVRAVRKAGEVTAGIRLAGTPDNLRSEVFSEPPLGDADALSYLLTGRPLASASSAGEGDTLGKAAFALGMSGAGTVASQVRTSLGLETLAVEGGADDGRIIAGKRIGNRLLVEYGYGLIDKLGTLLLRYEVNERLVLESRTGTVSNLDVVYSVKRR